MFVAAEIPRDKAVASKSKGNRPSDGEKNPLPKSPPSLSPALHAVLSSGTDVTATEEVNKAVERYCTVGEKLTTSGEDSSGPSGEQGYVLFPGKIALLQTAAVPGNQQNIVYLVGCATYFDQFGKRPVHHTRFCYYV